jgi:hypothetical protein
VVAPEDNTVSAPYLSHLPATYSKLDVTAMLKTFRIEVTDVLFVYAFCQTYWEFTNKVRWDRLNKLPG